jgi:RND superfamily putative drug exporter
VAKLTVVLSVNPYTQGAIDAVPQLQDAAQVALRAGHGIAGVVRVAGTTPDQWALSTVSQQDFIRTAILVLLTVYVLLAILLRSLVTPFYVIFSLGGMYLVTMSLLQGIFIGLFHKAGLSWTVPFFVFFLLVALGVDYSIFLMSRFDEEYRAGRTPVDAIRRAAAGMGGVIFSAAVIMAGTFGSLATSGITSLLEIGVAVILGLFLYTLVMLALFVPACAAIAGHGHRWPWRRQKPLTEPEQAPVALSA